MGTDRKKVVIVEDEPFIRMMMEDMLKRAGIEVIVLNDSELALDTVRHERPDAVILDWMMPKISGLELCKQIKAEPELAHIPVMMLTGKGNAEDEAIGMSAGVDVYQRKPFSPKVLLGQLRSMMGVAPPQD